MKCVFHIVMIDTSDTLDLSEGNNVLRSNDDHIAQALAVVLPGRQHSSSSSPPPALQILPGPLDPDDDDKDDLNGKCSFYAAIYYIL